MSEKLICAFRLCSAILFTAAAAVGQAQSAEPNRSQPNLVVIRALVLDKDRVAKAGVKFRSHVAKAGEEFERDCSQPGVDVFLIYTPYPTAIPTFCGEFAISGLTSNDFRIFEDGAEQKVQQVTVVPRSARTIADDMGIHTERSETPAGIWSTDDRSGSGLVGASSFYSIAYQNGNLGKAGCYKVEVKVDRGHALVLAPDEYCPGESPSDPLFGSKFGNQMERDSTSGKKAEINLSLRADYFYAKADEARVNVALEFPWNSLYREWNTRDWHLRASIGVLGMVYRKDGTLAARFSDFACCSADTSELAVGWDWTAFAQHDPAITTAATEAKLLGFFDSRVIPARYDTQVELPPGEYDLRVVLSDGAKFGRAETSLVIDPYGGKQLALSSIALGGRLRAVKRADQGASPGEFAPQYSPLVSRGIQLTPATDATFKKGRQLIAYFEVYEPLLVGASTSPSVVARIRILDANTGNVIKDFPPVDTAPYEQAGSPKIPIMRQIPFDQLPKGAYRLEVQATDSAGGSTPWRTATFTVD
jgi:hypothetical protein